MNNYVRKPLAQNVIGIIPMAGTASRLQHANVALGFPDMVFAPGNLFGQLLAKQKTTDADVVLGLFPANRPDKVDMVETDDKGKVKRIFVKPARTDLLLTWGVAVWSPAFSHFMHEFLVSHRTTAAESPDAHSCGAGFQTSLSRYRDFER